jgi:hypothetical protein
VAEKKRFLYGDNDIKARISMHGGGGGGGGGGIMCPNGLLFNIVMLLVPMSQANTNIVD